MESPVIFEPGIYYVGDPGHALSGDDLRALFLEILKKGMVRTGVKPLIVSSRMGPNGLEADQFWSVGLPHLSGTLRDQHENGWGFDWGSFGCIPYEWIEKPGSHQAHKIEFVEPFECFLVDNKITIGHFNFTL